MEPDSGSVAVTAASRIAAVLDHAVAARGAAAVAFSGGSTPAPMLRALAAAPVGWDRVTVFQVDERVAPDGSPDRNATDLVTELVEPAGVTTHLMPVTAPDLTAAAARYATLLQDACGGVLDVVHLGIGEDGHTASLVPGDPVLEITDADVAVTGPYQGLRRMTLTYPALRRARAVVWQVTGGDKARAVRGLLTGADVPAAGVPAGRAALVVDRAAAEQLPG